MSKMVINPNMTETHAKHQTNVVSVTKENEQGNQNVLTKTNARVTPTQERPWLWLQNLRSNKICTRRLSSLLSLLLKSFGNSFVWYLSHTFFCNSFHFFTFLYFLFLLCKCVTLSLVQLYNGACFLALLNTHTHPLMVGMPRAMLHNTSKATLQDSYTKGREGFWLKVIPRYQATTMIDLRRMVVSKYT